MNIYPPSILRLLNTRLVVLIVVFACALLPLHAASLDDLIYTTADGEITLKDCNRSARGELIIPNTIDGFPVTKIDTYAFRDCRNITSITIPEGVTEIGANGFKDCRSLATIIFRGNAPTLGWDVFYNLPSGATALVTVQSLSSFGELNENWNGLTLTTILSWSTTNGVVTITDCNEAATGELIIPDAIEGNPVTRIGGYAFNGSKLTSITIPSSVTRIEHSAFWACSSLTNVTIPDSITSIESFTFYYCSNLTSITIPESVTSIGDYAFDQCSSLANITIPEGVTSIGNGAFSGCGSLTKIRIPEGLTSIGESLFAYCNSLKSISIPDGVIGIGGDAFASCYNLESVSIPDSVTQIGRYAFDFCSSLKNITIPTGVTSIERATFLGCSSLTRVQIPEGVTGIGESAFEFCDNLEVLVFLGPAPSVGSDAFRGLPDDAVATVAPNKLSSFGEVGENWYGLTLQIPPTRTLTLLDLENGTVDGGGAYPPGTEVILTAIPSDGYTFVAWTGDSEEVDNPLIITMDVNKSFGAIFVQDKDGDELPDAWEVSFGLAPDSDIGDDGPDGDPDMDGLTNIQEFRRSSFPNDADSDDDNLLDGVETNTGFWVDATNRGTNPITDDTDSDNIFDEVETNTGIWVDDTDRGTSPLDNDSDNDGIRDDYETATGIYINTTNTGSNPNIADTDGDRLDDSREILANTDPNNHDTDGDGFNDGVEVAKGSDPNDHTNRPVLDKYLLFEHELHAQARDAYNGAHLRNPYDYWIGGSFVKFTSGAQLSRGGGVMHLVPGYDYALTSAEVSSAVTANDGFGSASWSNSGWTGLAGDSVTIGFYEKGSSKTFETSVIVDRLSSENPVEFSELGLTVDINEYWIKFSFVENVERRNRVFYFRGLDSSDIFSQWRVDGQIIAPIAPPYAFGQINEIDYAGYDSPINNALTINGADLEFDSTGVSSGSFALLLTPEVSIKIGEDYFNNELIGFGEANLSRSDFSNADFSGVNFSGANLLGANFSGANLSEANLSRAYLRDAILTDAYLDETDLSSLDLSGVVSGGITGNPFALPDGFKLIKGYLLGPNANLSGADLSGADLSGIDFSGANLTGADLTGTILSDADEDGLTEAEEQNLGTNPLNSDTDNDGLDDGDEIILETNPLDPDSDNDGYKDGQEQEEGTDPNESGSYPQRTLTVPTVGNGSVSGGGSYALGVTATLTATPATGYVFISWNSAIKNPLTITMDSNQSISAIFGPDTRDPDEDGLSNYQELILFNTDPTDSDSDDDGYLDGQEQGEGTDPNEAESYPQRTLTVPTVENGSVVGADTYALGAEAVLTATPSPGYVFASWNGDSTATDNPLTITMDDEQSVGAIFSQDTRDPDEDGLSNYQELVLFNTDPTDSDSDDDGYEDGQEQGEGTDPNQAESYPQRALTVPNVENGSVSGSGSYALGVTATLTATPAIGYVFTSWSGGSTATDNPLTITMDDEQSVGAIFSQDTRDPDEDGLSNYQELVLFKTNPADSDSDDDGYEDGQEQGEGTDPNQAESYPQRTLTVPTVENGSVSGSGSYALGVTTTLTATPATGYVFTSWSGGSTATDNPLTITMDSNQSISAIFGPDTRDPDEDGLSNYQELILFNTDPADSDSDDDGYPDGQEQTEGTDPNEAESFPTRVLTINDSANGTFTGGGVYQLGVTATLQAIPDKGYLFGGWVGEVIGESNPLSITMLVNQSVGANFEKDTRDSDEDGLSNYQELVVFNTDPTDSDSDDDGYLDGQEQTEGTDPNESNSYPTRSLATERVNNGSISGSGTYALGEEVVVTANPDPGFIFSWWSGNASGSVNPLAVIMTSNLSIGAAFVPDNRDNDGDGLSNFSELKIHNTDPNKFDSDGDGFSDGLEISERTDPNVSSLFPTRTIGISDSANGFVEGGGTYPLGVTIEVTATPSAGYLFFKWVGDVDGTENPLSLKISSNLNLEAIFQQDERDSDLDGLSNYQEIIVYNTDPNNPDSDGDGFNDGLEISEETNPNISSVFPTRSLLVVAPLNGSVNSQAIYPLDAIATLTATPEPGYVFYSWAGDTISSQNPLPVKMSENRILSAIFNQDERDSDGDGLSNYDEIVIHATNPNQMDTDEDGFDDDEEILKGTDPNDSQAFPERKPIELRIEKLNVPSLVIFAYWTGEVGKTYRIEYAADFQNWNILDSGIKGTGLEQSRALPGPKGYVRVVEE
ncbi:leucine-rich repeat protein [bacterium]|nr:leucine-rich repeat protein [bacterium]